MRDIDQALNILAATAWQIAPENRRGRKYRLRHKRAGRPLTNAQVIVRDAIAAVRAYRKAVS